MIVKNYTPHDINIINNITEKKVIATFPSSGAARSTSNVICGGFIKDEDDMVIPVVAINATALNKSCIATDEGAKIPIISTVFSDVTGLPNPEPDTIYIVSRITKNRLPERPDLVTPDQLIRDENGTLLGCLSLSIT